MTVRIVVVGAGYSGLSAAKLAARWTDASVTLVNGGDRFVERVRLHQLATGQSMRDLPLAGLVKGTGVRLVIDRVTGIDAADRVVRLAGSTRELPYDLLVYALGSVADTASVPGVAEHAYPLATADDALRLRARLSDSDVVAVVGGGLTGIEAAAELAETYPGSKVRFVNGGALGAGLSQRGRDHLRRTFDRLGVEVLENSRVSEVRADGLALSDGAHVGADTVVWTAGFKVPELAREAGFAVDDNDRLIVDKALRSVSHPEVIGVGDVAAARMPSGQELRMACATGLPTTQHAMRALAVRLTGKAPKSLRYSYFIQCISLGRRDALIQFVHADDSPREAVLTGRKAAWCKEMIVRYALMFQRHPSIPV